MARRSGMMTALQAALAGFSGGIEGRMQQRAADEEKSRLTAALNRQKEQDAFAKASFLQNAGYRIAPEAYDTEDPEARRGLMPLSSPEPMTKPELRAAGALDSAIKRGMGVDTTQPSIGRPTFSQAPLALDTGVTRMTDVFERAKGMRPAQEQAAASVDLPGVGAVRFLTPESDDAKMERELKKYQAQQDVITTRQKAEQDRANRGFFAILSRAKALPEGVTYEEVQDIDLKPFFQEYSQGRSADAALQRANVVARSQAGMGSYVTGLTPEGQPNIFFGTRGGQITPTGVGAPKNATEGKIPPSDKKSMVELEASIKELDKALAAVQASPNAFGLKTVLPNVAVSRTQGVKPRADVTGAIVKLRRTEFGTAMSRQEKESGETLFPAGGDDAKTLTDKLNALKEKAQIELDTKREYYGTQPTTTRTDTSTAAKPAAEDPDFTAAKAAIAAGKDRNAVIQRYQSSGKKWPGGA